MKAKIKNLQPWLDYFRMLQTHEEKGLLQMEPEKHEAYITEPCLCALSSDGDISIIPPDEMVLLRLQLARRILSTLRRIRTYAGWLSQHGSGYLSRSFALHVVADRQPHDLLYTLLIEPRRRWWTLWIAKDAVELIDYREQQP